MILVLNGPNLNMLGKRDPAVYGTVTLNDIISMLSMRAKESDETIFAYQSNHEGDLIDKLQEYAACPDCRGAIINAGALSHYSYALRDAVSDFGKPVIEVHMSNIFSRDEFRHQSVISPVCMGVICGFGTQSYMLAISALLQN